jgi:Fe-S cluster assembly protein SufB
MIQIKKGLNRQTVEQISRIKGEPRWMLEFRLKAYEKFERLGQSKITQNINHLLERIDYSDITYYKADVGAVSSDWAEVPENIKQVFDEVGIPEAEQKFLAGVSSQFESEVVYHSTKKELEDLGVIFLDTDTALRLHPELFRKYFGSVVEYDSNKYSALNGAVWSGGSFIYVPKDTRIDKPLQSYFRINAKAMGQFERTLIIVDENSSLNYVEGCTAPLYTEDSLHVAVVEIVVEKNAKCRYTTIQNWSANVVNLVTKRAVVKGNGLMEWVDGNIGSKINVKYPSCYLVEPYAAGSMISIACSRDDMVVDAGTIMKHFAPRTSSNIISKSIIEGKSLSNFKSLVWFTKDAGRCQSIIKCDSLMLSQTDDCASNTYPLVIQGNDTSSVEHEASISKISKEQLSYLMLKGLSEDEASKLIVSGFIEVFSKELPMEYAVELNRLIKLDLNKKR